MQLVVPVVQVKGNLVKSGYFGPEKYIIATPVLLPMDLKLESKFDCPGVFRPSNKNAIVTPFFYCYDNISTSLLGRVQLPTTPACALHLLGQGL